MSDERTPPRATKKRGVQLLSTIGQRLISEERAPYELPDHDDVVALDDPTGDIPLKSKQRDDA
jgi:hypothetical protein